MNPPISGQNMTRNDIGGAPRCGSAAEDEVAPRRSTVEGDLFARRGERPRHLEPTLLAEHEAKLARRPESFGVSRAEGRARTAL